MLKMKNIVLLLSVFMILRIEAQTPTFKGQPPIERIATESKPIQKQWKGNFTFNNSTVVFSYQHFYHTKVDTKRLHVAF